MLYDVSLTIAYAYDSPAVAGRHLVRLLPADLPGEQRLVAGHLDIQPPPAERHDRTDFFGNATTEFSFREPHKDFSLRLLARVDRSQKAEQNGGSTLLSHLSAEISSHRSLSADAPAHFIASSRQAETNADMAAYARSAADSGMTAHQAMIAVGQALHRDMKYDPKATTVETPAAVAFAARHGVCQDFSHIMIACLRSLGIPAGYVSGFLRTIPPPGKSRLEGADAMHAWVRAWCGRERGWAEYDPTNAIPAGSDHIVVARGRDYFDVAPVKGILRATGGQHSKQAVDVVPLDPAAASGH